jgi:hypothetical protein
MKEGKKEGSKEREKRESCYQIEPIQFQFLKGCVYVQTWICAVLCDCMQQVM